MKCKWKNCKNEAKENPYRGKQPLFCSTQCKNKNGVDQLRQRRKQQAIDFLGGKCSTCGYNKSLAALHIHHIDPSQKEFEINRGISLSWDRIKEELLKCKILCANCHAEEHWG